MAKQQKKSIQERDLLKALNELEDIARKGGDPLLSADTEGGLSTEGTPLSGKAPSGKKGDLSKMLSASDIEDDDEEAHGRRSKKKGGVYKAADDASEEDDEAEEMPDDESEDDEDEEEEPAAKSTKKSMTMKSFRTRAEEDETIQKGLEVSDLIESMVDQLSNSLADVQKALAHVDSVNEQRLAKSIEMQNAFNIGLAKAVVALGTQVSEMNTIVKSFGRQPNVPQRRAVLSKSEIVSPSFGSSQDDASQPLAGVSPLAVTDWLVSAVAANKLDPIKVTEFEQSGFNPAVLPPQVYKALVDDLGRQ